MNIFAQAFDVCWTRKAKCDEAKPSCGFCQENHMACNYQLIAPVKYCYSTTHLFWDMLTYSKADRASQVTLHQLTTNSSQIQDLQKEIEAKFDKIEHLLADLSSSQATSSSPYGSLSSNGQSAVDASLSGLHLTLGTNPSAVVSGTPVVFHIHEMPVTVEHITAAHRLLSWPFVKALVSKSELAASLNKD